MTPQRMRIGQFRLAILSQAASVPRGQFSFVGAHRNLGLMNVQVQSSLRTSWVQSCPGSELSRLRAV